jgi:primosomal protein N' (replication factor Y)
MTAARVCRVVVDVLAVERAFDYLVPDELGEAVTVGTVVRVGLAGRRVRGWVVADGVEPEAAPERLRPLLAAVSAGPPPDVVELIAWAAWRFAGPRLPLLRAASPPAIVPPARPVPASPAVAPDVSLDAEAMALAAGAAGRPVAIARWPPAADPAGLVAAFLPASGSSIVVVADARVDRVAVRLARDGWPVVPLLAQGRPLERARAWDRARRGGCVVVGGRSAVLAPVPDLAAGIVLDEGSEALKEERSPLWHARDLALERARRAGARVVLVSPAPSLEALAAGRLVRPSRSAEREGWPIVEVVDRRREAPGLGLFSSRLVAAARSALESDGRVVCVLNRRGRARLLACTACGELARCERCRAAVGESQGKAAVLACSACGRTRPRLCARCGDARLKILRAGVARAGEELAALLPRAGVASVDAATTKLPGEPVVIGTEAVLHRVESASLVAFVDFDQELLAPRFRAGEQALWLLVRAARLVGPRRAGGRLVVQTRLPRHEVLEAAVRADPGVLAAAEDPRRRMLRLPPYAALARLTGEPSALEAAAGALRRARAEVAGVPAGAGLLVRAATPDRLAAALAEALPPARAAGRLRAEVDPLRV